LSWKFSIEIEHGKVLHIVVLAISELMIETGEREVFFQVNGQLRSMKVKDKAAIKDRKVHAKVDKNQKNQIGKLEYNQSFIKIFTRLFFLGAPMPGQVLDIKVKEGDIIKKGDTVLVLSAMKVCKNIKLNQFY